MAVVRVGVHIHQEGKFEKEGCRLSGHCKSAYCKLNEGKIKQRRWQWDVLV